MDRCTLTYEPMDGEGCSPAGLKKLSPRLTRLEPFMYSAAEQRYQASQRAAKMSIQGMQPKLSARLQVSQGRFAIVDSGGEWIVKPQHHIYPQLPENEDLTMKLATHAGLTVPVHGLIRCSDESLSYVIRRFDRPRRGIKLAQEDFAQLTGRNRKTKYDSSMEQLVPVLDRHCTFPQLERLNLFRLTLFCFVTGNEDMHLKNFSLVTRDDKVGMSPAYDLLNTTIALSAAQEEVALPLRGKKRKLTDDDWLFYWARERLELTEKSIQRVLTEFQRSTGRWTTLIERSFLSTGMKEAYSALLGYRLASLGI